MQNTDINTQALIQLRTAIDGDAEDLAEFIDDFSEIAPDLFSQMQTAADKCDWKSVKIASHSLKSNARDLGASDLGDLCADLEKEADEAHQVKDIDAKLAAIHSKINEALSALKTLDLNSF
ncbi:MAG: Hpt domain-containing protein [Rhodothermales bacterium]